MGKILSRIQEIASNEGISIGALERKLGASKGVLSRAIANGTDIQSKWIQLLVENYPLYSPDWLLTGRGQMLLADGRPAKQEKPVAMVADGQDCKPIPLVKESAAAGFGGSDFHIAVDDVKEYYVVPKFRFCNVDFMIEVSGTSMYPHFNPGDVIACSILHNSHFIQWNKCHVIATREQGILVKRLLPGNDDQHLKAVSDNKDYLPFEIPTEEITGIALVVGSVSLE